MQPLSDEMEEVLLAISASGFDWVATIARREISASETMPTDPIADIDVRQFSIIQSVLDRFQ